MYLGRTSSAGFHHMSTRITLLQAVKLRPAIEHNKELIGGIALGFCIPVLPALKEIKMTQVVLLDLIF